MPATIIPVQGIYLGFVGNISNEGYSLRTPRQVNLTANNIGFGETLVLNSNNTYSSVKQFIAGGGTMTATTPMGIAVSNVHTNGVWPQNGGTNLSAGFFAPGQMCDALVQGTINVYVQNGTPTGAQGPVYLRVALNAAIPAAVVGGLEAVVDPNPVTGLTITTTSGSNSATVSSATGLVVGQIVSSANLPAGTSITAISGTTLTLSANATAGASGTAATFTSNLLLTNVVFKTGYLETDGTAQVTILLRQMA
jgi:hypothetical protein